jgi:cytochrome c oxidase subunit 2
MSIAELLDQPPVRYFLPVQGSEYAARVDLLMVLLVAVLSFFTALIAGTICVFAVRYRRRPGPRKPPPSLKAQYILEAVWIAVPLAIVMAIFLIGANLYVDAAAVPQDAEEILVVGKQWMWKLQHEDGAREIDELHVPVGRDVKLVMISQDVIHSFYVPELRLKMDVLPDRYTFLSFKAAHPGVFRLFCAEFCGTQHSRMFGRVVAMAPEDYARWLADHGSARSMAVAGAEVFETAGCPSCHRSELEHRAPVLDGVYGSRVLLSDGSTVVADENYLRESIVAPAAKVVAGWGAIMPAYGQSLSDEEVAQLVAYIKSLGAQLRPPRERGLLDDTP